MRALLLAALLACLAASGASFDCTRARSTPEKIVCGNAELSDLDDVMARYYHGAMEALKENGSCLREDQMRWLAAKRARCNSSACLRDVYLNRLGELYAIQPGINTQRRLPLPPVPSLVWAMAPLPEESPDVASRQAWIEGELRYDEAIGAYVIRTAQGKPYILLLDLMRGGANEIYLSSLSKAPGEEKFAARGRVSDDGGRTTPFFDHRACVFLYRLPR